jgi:hypothetical protein
MPSPTKRRSSLNGVEDFRQRVYLGLWDFRAAFDYSLDLDFKPTRATVLRRQRQEGPFSHNGNYYQLEYLRTESLDKRIPPTPFWFVELIEAGVFAMRQDVETVRVRDNDPWHCLRRHGHGVFVPFEGVFTSTLLAHLVVRLHLVTGARLGEIQQIAQSRDCIKELVNVGPKGTTRWLLRLVPKGRRERENYYLDSETKDFLMAAVRFLRAKFKSKLLPMCTPEKGSCLPDRYIFQWNGQGIPQMYLNTLIRFLLPRHRIRHGCRKTCSHNFAFVTACICD